MTRKAQVSKPKTAPTLQERVQEWLRQQGDNPMVYMPLVILPKLLAHHDAAIREMTAEALGRWEVEAAQPETIGEMVSSGDTIDYPLALLLLGATEER